MTPNQKEAYDHMQKALEKLLPMARKHGALFGSINPWTEACDIGDTAIAAVKKVQNELVQSVEPVAWYEHNSGLDAWFLAYSKNPNQGIKSRPLYLHPPQPQATTPKSETLSYFEMRGVLASNLLCWNRLTEAEAQDLVCFFEKVRTAQGEKL